MIKKAITHTGRITTMKLFFNHIIRTRTKEITKCGLISRSVREINMLSVKIESNTGPIGQLFC